MMRTNPQKRLEFLRYLASSGVAFGADFALFNAALAAGRSVPSAAALGFGLGVLVTYILSVQLVFKDRALSDRRVEFAAFIAIGVGGLLLTEAFLWLLAGQAGWRPQAAKLAAAGATFFFNFGCRKTLLFTRRPAPGMQRG